MSSGVSDLERSAKAKNYHTNWSQIPFIIPIRGYTSSMRRLRKSMPNSLVDSIVEQLFMQTLQVMQRFGLSVQVLTADQRVENFAHLQRIPVFIDLGRDLNEAVQEFVLKIDAPYIGLIMPDLPGLAITNLELVLSHLQNSVQLIVPTIDQGTSIAILHRSYWLKGLLGDQSALKFRNLAQAQQDPLTLLSIPELSRDLDTWEDLHHWQNYHTSLQKLYQTAPQPHK